MDTEQSIKKEHVSIQSIFLSIEEDIFSSELEKKTITHDDSSSSVSSSSSEYVSYPLKTNWVLWHHSPFNKNWNISSYDYLYKIKTVEDFWALFSTWNSYLPSIKDSMFFIMKDGVKPIWEDTNNKNGGCWSLRIEKENIKNTWLELSMALIGTYITKRKSDYDVITGLSISPKKTFSIIKIWCSENTGTVSNFISSSIPNVNTTTALFKIHKESIIADKAKKTRYPNKTIGRRR